MNKGMAQGLQEALEFLQEQAKGRELSADEAREMLTEFLAQHGCMAMDENAAEDAYDYLELAEQAGSKKKQEEYLKKALALEPENLDVLMRLALHEAEENVPLLLEKLEALLEKGKQALEKEGLYEESVGVFWGVTETRPYMRVMKTYMDTMVGHGMLRKATAVGEEMLRLSTGDNMGVRFTLMVLYAILEEKEKMQKLLTDFADEAESRSVFLLPHAMLCFKQGEFAEAERLVKQLQKVNRDFKKFVGLVLGDRLDEIFVDYFGYQPGTIEELAMQVQENPWLLATGPAFFVWAKQVLKPGRRKSKK